MLTIISMFLALLMPSSGGQPAAQPIKKDPVVIKMTAKKYEFSPSVVTVTKGQQVKIEITATDRTHGFAINDYNVDTKLKEGVPTTVEFVADREGEFTFKCSDFCGLGHSKMKGKLIVKPAA